MSFKLFTNTISLAAVDGSRLLRIPIFPISDKPIIHPKAGEMVFNSAFAKKLIENFTVYPGEVPLDFDHGVENATGNGEAIAAGWLKKVVIENDEVVAYADPTERGLSKVEAKEYKLSSASLSFDWQNPDTGKKIGPVLLSVALTNRPFIRGMGEVTPIDSKAVSLKDKEDKMGTISLDDHLKKVAEVNASLSDASTKLTAAESQVVSLNTQLSEMKTQLSAFEAKVKEMETEKAKAVALADVDKLISDGKALPAEKDSLLELRIAHKDLFVKLTENRPTIVNMSARGVGGKPERDDADKGKALVQKANEIADKEKVSFSDALRLARVRNPEFAGSL